MRVSQLLHAMDKGEYISIDDYDAPITECNLYRGIVRGISKDNPINRMHVKSICADNDTILVLAVKQREKGGEG